MKKKSKIYIAGHKGLTGSALLKKLLQLGFQNIITRNRQELDLLIQQDVQHFFETERPEYVFICAAKVGGIYSNNIYPADFIYENLQIQNNLIHSAHLLKVKKLILMGSSCIYPREAPQPIKEEYLLTGPLERTNEAYAVAKIAGLMMTKKYMEQYNDNFISAMPTNLYGPKDNFHPQNSHVIPGMIQRFHKAKLENKNQVIIWGTGKPKREFLYVDDLADALIFLMHNYQDKEHINVGTGRDISIFELAQLIKSVVGFKGKIVLDTSKPDGTLKKRLDVSKINKLGWKAKVSLKVGLQKTYDWYLKNLDNIKKK